MTWQTVNHKRCKFTDNKRTCVVDKFLRNISACLLYTSEKLRHRGPDSWGEWVGEHAVFAHSRLAVIDVENGLQPMKRTVEGHEFVITYNGELYNTNDIRNDLKSHGYEFTTASDTEVLLYAYIHLSLIHI